MPISSLELKNYILPSKKFVETGSAGLGLGIKSALKAGFEDVFSIEINPVAYQECFEIFKNDSRVHLTLGDCSDCIGPILKSINAPCTIYLDANGWHQGEAPLFNSLKAIYETGINNNIILIDDMNHKKQSRKELENRIYSMDFVKELLKINNNYKLSLIDTHTEEQDHTFECWVLAACP